MDSNREKRFYLNNNLKMANKCECQGRTYKWQTKTTMVFLQRYIYFNPFQLFKTVFVLFAYHKKPQKTFGRWLIFSLPPVCLRSHTVFKKQRPCLDAATFQPDQNSVMQWSSVKCRVSTLDRIQLFSPFLKWMLHSTKYILTLVQTDKLAFSEIKGHHIIPES